MVNPASGPGAAPTRPTAGDRRRAGRRRARARLRADRGGRAPAAAAVEADIDRYREWYGVDGVFLDEAAPRRSSRDYHALPDHARAAGATFVVLNPGVVPARGYFDIADVVVTFEGPIAAYRERPPDRIAPERTAHLVYGASASRRWRRSSRAPGAGYVYLTSGTLPHPWGTVPDYLAHELAALGGCG